MTTSKELLDQLVVTCRNLKWKYVIQVLINEVTIKNKLER